MELLTHALAGPLIGRAGLEQRVPRRATALLVVSALSPDIDNLLYLKGTAAYMDYHRSLTHSLLGGLALAAIIAFAFWRFPKREGQEAGSFLNYFLLGIAGVYSHIFLDLITSYGTQILFPFSSHRYSLYLVFIIDPLFTLLFTIPFWPLGLPRRARARVGAAAVLSYLVLCGALNLLVRHMALQTLRSDGLTVENVTVMPRPPSPLSWYAISESPGGYEEVLVNLWAPHSISVVAYPRDADPRLLDRAEQLPDVQAFFRFSRYPYISTEETPDGRVMSFFDLRFNSFPGRNSLPFLLQVSFDASGRITHSEFIRSRGDRHWKASSP